MGITETVRVDLKNTRSKLRPSRSFWAAVTLLLALSIYLALVPLFDLLGYEFCAALSFLASMTAGPVAIAVIKKYQSTAAFGQSVQRLYLKAALYNLLTLLPPLAVIVLNAFRVQNCNLAKGFLFFWLMPLSTVLISTGWGCAIGFWFKRRFAAGAVYIMVWIFVLVFNLLEFWFGPHMDSYNQLTGWIAGPIYDEVVEPGTALFFSRLFGLCVSMAVLGLTGFLKNRQPKSRDHQSFYLWRPTSRHTWIWFLGGVFLWMYSDALGFGRSHASIQSILSQTLESEHFVLHVRPGLSARRARRLLDDHEFRYRQIESVLGPLKLPRIHSYVFSSSSLKKRHLGAERVQYAKPWQFSLYLHGEEFPHAALKHELIHVMAASFGSWPAKTSARFGVWQNVGLLEGLAVAVEWPVVKYDPHTWSAAQKQIGKAPRLESLFDPLGFWSAPARGSYNLTGSFVRFLLDRYGPERLKNAYRSGSLREAYSKPPSELFAEYAAFLEKLPLEPGVITMAAERFAAPSIFRKSCAHEIAYLKDRTFHWMHQGKCARAESSIQAALDHLPDDADLRMISADVKLRCNRPLEAEKELLRIQKDPALSEAKLARIHGISGDAMIAMHRYLQADSHYQTLLDASLDDATERLVTIKLAALQKQPKAEPFLTLVLQASLPDASALLRAREYLSEHPDFTEGWYLLGKIALQLDNPELAIQYFHQAYELGPANAALRVENLRSLAKGLYLLGKYDQCAQILAVLLETPRHPEDTAWALEWLERISPTSPS